MKKLGGWTRLGVVLSVLWCIGVVVNAAIQYQDMVEEQKEPHSPSFTAKDMNRVYGASFFEWRDPKPWEMNWSNEVPATSGPKREKTTPIAQSEQPPRFEDTFPIDASSPSGYTPKGQFLDGEQPAFQSPAPSAPATPPPTRKKDIFDELEGKQPAPSPSRPLLKPFDPDAYLAKTKAVIGFRIKPAPLLAVAFGPIAAAWLTLLGVTATVRWVRQGFRSRRCDSAPESRSAGVTGAAAPAIQGPHRHWRDMYWMRINWPQRVVLVLGMVAFLAWGVAWFGTGINLENERRQVVRYIAPRFFELLAGWLMAALPTAALFFVFKSRESKPTGDV